MRYRLTHAAQSDVVSILAWSEDRFGAEARERYRALIATAIRDAASRPDEVGHVPRPELGEGVFSWHLSQSRTRSPGGLVRRPRHFLICRRDGDVLVIGGSCTTRSICGGTWISSPGNSGSGLGG